MPASVPRQWTGSPTVAGTLSPFDAVIFDLDGVVTDTASVHRTAWKKLFDTVLADARILETSAAAPFQDSDYFTFIEWHVATRHISILRYQSI